MKLHVIAYGKLKTPGLAEAGAYYGKLLRGFVAWEECELKPLQVPDKGPSTRARIQEEEAALLETRLRSRLSSRGRFFLLDEAGPARSTAQWAALVREWEASGAPDIAVCLGSSLGFSLKLKRQAAGLLSLGPQTLPHELARVVLLEQLYRAWGVTRGHPYHVEG